MEGVGGALRQCVYQLKYRHLLLRNSVFFWGGGGRGGCVHMAMEHTHTHTHKSGERAVVKELIRLFELRTHTGRWWS